MQLAAVESAAPARRLAGAAGAGRRGAARRDRAARRQGQARAPGRPRRRSPSPASPFEALRDWLGEARSAARARPVEAQLLKARHRLQRLDHRQPRRRLVIRTQAQPPALGADRRRHRLERVDPRRAGLGRGARRRGALGRRRRARSACSSAWSLFAPAAWLAERGGLGHRPAPAAGRCARHGLVRQRRAGPHRRRRTAATPAPCPAGSSGRCRRAATASSCAARQDCCLNGTLQLQIRPGFGRITRHPACRRRRTGVGQWPSAWLGGLGTPWNTLQLGGTLAPRLAGRDDRVGRRAAGALDGKRRPRAGRRVVAPDDARHARQLPRHA